MGCGLKRPKSTGGQKGRGAGVPWGALYRFVAESMPVAAIAHSHHADALMDPHLWTNPLFQEFSLIELNELHHQVAVLGTLLRHQMGDPTALASLGMNLAGFLENRQAGLAVASQFPPEITSHPKVQEVMRLTQLSNEQVAANMPVIERTLALAESPAPGALLVRPPRAFHGH
jgi:hypothetical protein